MPPAPRKAVRLATWNINSVRLRIGLIEDFVVQKQPDILCLQEIKCTDDQFPTKRFKAMGFEHIAVHGQPGYHGVATVSKIPFTDLNKKSFCGKEDARHICVTFGDKVHLHNFYVPAGGDIPDPKANEKFAHKLDFLAEMTDWFKAKKSKKTNKLVLVGDLNVAPLETDVWSHKQLLKVVSHTPIEVDNLNRVQAAHNWIDITRKEIPEPERVFTWWSYRSPDWTKNNRGRRLDHIWVTPALENAAHSVEVFTDARSWEKPSDHVPVLATLNLD